MGMVMSELNQRIQVENRYKELFEKLNNNFLCIGIRHNLLLICIETFAWCYKIHYIVKHRIKNGVNGSGTSTADDANGDDDNDESNSKDLPADTNGQSTAGLISVEFIQNLLKEGTLLESKTTEVIRTFSESSLEVLVDDEETSSSSSSGSKVNSNVAAASMDDETPNHCMLVTNYTQVCNDDVQRSEYGESMCFELVEYWRQKLIMILMEYSSKYRDGVSA